jgi:Spy/CpxP family protein refolding chaperone
MTNIESNQPQGIKKKMGLKKYLLFSLVFIIVAGIAGGIVFAQKVKQYRDKGPLFFMMQKVTKELDLNEEQKAELDKIRQEIKSKMESRKKDRDALFTDFENAFKQDKLDKQVLKDLAAKREAEKEDMKDFLMDELIKFHAILTPEQRTKAVEKFKEMREKRHKKLHDRNFDKPFDDPQKN